MKRSVLIFGLILGSILAANALYMADKCYTNPDFQGNAVVGYSVMVVVLSLIFFGTRNYRNNYSNGVISLGKAFKVGALIAVVASTIYLVAWLFYFYLFIPDFMDKYVPHVLKEASREGATATELAAKTKEMANFREMYKSPVFVVLITYAEVLPIGLIVAFVSALILKKKAHTIAV